MKNCKIFGVIALLAMSCTGASNDGTGPNYGVSLSVNGRNVPLMNSSKDLTSAPTGTLNITNDEALFGVAIAITSTSDNAGPEYCRMGPGLTATDWISSGKLTFMDRDILAIKFYDGNGDQFHRLRVEVALPDVAYNHDLEFRSWALTPPMGWNTFDAFGCNVTEEQVMQNALYMARNLRNYGYEYVVVDGRWFVENQTWGHLVDNPIFVLDEWGRHTPAVNRFPSAAGGAGFIPLANYLHSRGLKFGIHIMRGIPVEAVKRKSPIKGANGVSADQIYTTANQCTWNTDNYTILPDRPGAQEYYDSIFELYAEWGVDYVKIDDISSPYFSGEIEMVRNAIRKTGRPIVLSLSPGSTPIANAEHVETHANLWRMTNDVWDRWGDVVHLIDTAKAWYPQHIGPGYWPDADMMPFGKLNLTGHVGPPDRFPRIDQTEQYTLRSLFAILRSPLMLGSHLLELKDDEFTTNLIINEEVLYITKRSTNNREIYANSDRSIVAWTADDSLSGDKFLALFYCGALRPGNQQLGPGYTPSTAEIPFDLSLLGFTVESVTIRDLWQKEDLGEFAIAEQFAPELQFHGVGLYRLSP